MPYFNTSSPRQTKASYFLLGNRPMFISYLLTACNPQPASASLWAWFIPGLNPLGFSFEDFLAYKNPHFKFFRKWGFLKMLKPVYGTSIITGMSLPV
jgi:hypothetical protein